MKKSQSRQRTHQIRVPALPSEVIEIKNNAAKCGLSVASYLRELGLNYEPESILDADIALELIKINSDLGRLGGLLKMWLTNDERFQTTRKDQVDQIILDLLNDIKTTQALLFETVKKV